MNDQPIIPDYSGANVRAIVPTLLAPSGGADRSWMPAPVHDARQVVILVLDGLGWEQFCLYKAHMPTLATFQGGPITTVAPSTTATALTSITTGLTPGEHGLVGYRMEVGGEVLNVLRWATESGDARRKHEPRRVQPFAPFMGEPVPVVTKADFERTAFTEAHLRGGRMVGWRAASSLAVTVGQLLREGEPLIYAYYDGVDKIAHERGFGPYYEAELRSADDIVQQVRDQLVDGSVLLVTADHGQVDVGTNTRELAADVAKMTRNLSGEGRFRWLHARPGMADDLLAAALAMHGDVAWAMSRAELVDGGWFGPVVSPPVASRFGDVALITKAPVSFVDVADSGPYPLVCRHGSLTSAEMLVPLLASTS
ncbi:MAG TPA: alkaline phosphatase family protein [Ilumatobacteraceae bacterium]|nr:alkaline phosphatase family protein [Ilumatobacteraceae bacterium]